jgi:hypothetical protein
VVRLNRWFARHRDVLNIVGWISFAVVCADYARFIHLPEIAKVPFWLGVIFNVLRWGVWEGIARPVVDRAIRKQMTSEAAADLPPAQEH